MPTLRCTLGSWETDAKGAPRFRMGNYTLNGKFEDLKKPLLLMHRDTERDGNVRAWAIFVSELLLHTAARRPQNS